MTPSVPAPAGEAPATDALNNPEWADYPVMVRAYLAIETALAKRILADRNAARAAPRDWPAGQSWDELGQRSHETFWRNARIEAGLPQESSFKNDVILGASGAPGRDATGNEIRLGDLPSVNIRHGVAYSYCPECGTEAGPRASRGLPAALPEERAPSDEQLLDAYIAACNRESDLQDAELSPKHVQAGIVAAMRKVLSREPSPESPASDMESERSRWPSPAAPPKDDRTLLLEHVVNRADSLMFTAPELRALHEERLAEAVNEFHAFERRARTALGEGSGT